MNAKDPDTENADLGKMLVKTFPPALSTTPLFEAQVMIKHPNSNGMQLDIDTGGYIPARFIKEMTVKRGDDLVFRMESTFSSSTSPWSIPTARCSRRSRKQAARNFRKAGFQRAHQHGSAGSRVPRARPRSHRHRPPHRPQQRASCRRGNLTWATAPAVNRLV